MGGSNPIRERCPVTEGCYIYNRWPRVELLAGFLPRNAQFTDIDSSFWRGHATDISGHFLFLEWKSWPRPSPLDKGQHIFFERLSRVGNGRIFVLCVAGDVVTMTVTHIAQFWRGRWTPWREATTAEFCDVITRWGKWADAGGCNVTAA